MIFRQLFDRVSCTYTYLLADPLVRQAVLIDPVLSHVDRDIKLLDELGLDLRYILETHVHADHITGAAKIRSRIPSAAIVYGSANKVQGADLLINDKEFLAVGSIIITARHTPGHTSGCCSYITDILNKTYAFTGDTILIRGCGRTDFQEGSSKTLYESVKNIIFALPDAAVICPGHDYNGFGISTVGEEKNHNPRFNRGLQHFESVMDNLKLAYPAKIKIAVLANQICGDV